MSNVLYTHATLTQASQELLLNWWESNVGELLPDKIAHHMTIKFKPNVDDIATTPLGDTVSLRVAGWGQSDVVQAVYVFASVASFNDIPHVTVAVDRARGGKPKDSNQILSNKITPFDGPKLEAIVEATLKNGSVIRTL